MTSSRTNKAVTTDTTMIAVTALGSFSCSSGKVSAIGGGEMGVVSSVWVAGPVKYELVPRSVVR